MSYKTIQLPTEFVEQQIDPLVEKKRLGYTSRAHVVIDAVKQLVEKIENQPGGNT